MTGRDNILIEDTNTLGSQSPRNQGVQSVGGFGMSKYRETANTILGTQRAGMIRSGQLKTLRVSGNLSAAANNRNNRTSLLRT